MCKILLPVLEGFSIDLSGSWSHPNGFFKVHCFSPCITTLPSLIEGERTPTSVVWGVGLAAEEVSWGALHKLCEH